MSAIEADGGEASSERELDLRGITTQWSQIQDSNIFVLRYAEAARNYLERLVGNRDDAEEILQSFLVKMLENGFHRATPDKGRFRFYLIRAIKNEAITFHRKQTRRRWKSIVLAQQNRLSNERTIDDDWNQSWTKVLLERAWNFLKSHQKVSPGNYCYSVLQATTESPEKSSAVLAMELSATLSQPMTAEAFRKQVSRARRLFAEAILREVSETIESAEPTIVLEELGDLGLLVHVRDFLPKEFVADSDE